MDEELLYQTIFKRKSIRKYELAPLDNGTMEMILSRIATLKPMIAGIRTEIRMLKGEEVKGMFRADAPHYLAIYSEDKEGFLANAGFILQQLDLFFSANGIGCCWLGGSKPTKKVEPLAGLEFVIILAFGKPTETLQRNSVTEFKRRALSDISDIKGMDDLMEPLRLAPSGMNNQSWYYRGDANRIDAYYAKSMMADQMNQINLGIGLCHLWLSAVHFKKEIEFLIERPDEGRTPKGYRYVVSAKMH
ncbi:MAG TPA: nitroreductase family protein [Methanomassiliicoccales archaeon]